MWFLLVKIRGNETWESKETDTVLDGLNSQLCSFLQTTKHSCTIPDINFRIYINLGNSKDQMIPSKGIQWDATLMNYPPPLSMKPWWNASFRTLFQPYIGSGPSRMRKAWCTTFFLCWPITTKSTRSLLCQGSRETNTGWVPSIQPLLQLEHSGQHEKLLFFGEKYGDFDQAGKEAGFSGAGSEEALVVGCVLLWVFGFGFLDNSRDYLFVSWCKDYLCVKVWWSNLQQASLSWWCKWIFC